jgi:hypothetical protein
VKEAEMTARYIVLLEEDQWMIRYKDRHYGPYPGRHTAFRLAVDMAHIVSLSGGDSEVLVQWDEDSFDIEWKSDRDPYPPV